MVRAGKHGNSIGGRGRCSAFYLGSALMYARVFNRRTRVSGKGLNHSFIFYVFFRDPFHVNSN